MAALRSLVSCDLAQSEVVVEGAGAAMQVHDCAHCVCMRVGVAVQV